MSANSIPVIETSRLILRPFNLSDADRVQQLAGQEEIARNTLAMPFPYLPGMADAWISTHESDFQDGKSAIFAITRKDDMLMTGAVGLSLQLHYRLAEIGYWIGKEFWNRGYCTEAVTAIIDFGFGNLHLHKIHATHFAGNPASGRVMKKAGMFYEGTLRSHMFHWNEYKDLMQYGIINPEEVSQ